jgi:hypothetical protein
MSGVNAGHAHLRDAGNAAPQADRPNGLINLIYLTAVLLAAGVVTLRIGLFQA